MSTLSYAPECRQVYEELKIRRKHKYILFKMDDENTLVTVESVGARDKTFADLKSSLPERECRFAIYDHEIETADRGKTNKLWLIVWIPFNSTAHKKMQYSAAKTKFQETCLPGCFECQAANLDEVEVALGLKKEEVDDGGEEDFDF